MYVTGELAGGLLGTVDGVLAKWEDAITSRLSTPPATGAAAAGVRAAAEAACTTDLERIAVRLVEEKGGVMELARGLRELPTVAAGAINVTAFRGSVAWWTRTARCRRPSSERWQLAFASACRQMTMALRRHVHCGFGGWRSWSGR